MTRSLLDAFDVVVHSETLLANLRKAQQTLGKKQQLTDEKQWLTAGVERLAAAREGKKDLALKTSRLPELESVRGDMAKALQHQAVDAVERLQAGITFHAGPRAPVLEELFGHLKLPALRRAFAEDFEKFIASFSKRLKTQYVRRIFSDPDFTFALGAVEQVTVSFASWRDAFSTERLPEAEEAALREQLMAAADELEAPSHQARLLAEAALMSLGVAFAASGIGAKMKKRALAKAPAPIAEVEQPVEAVVPVVVEAVSEVVVDVAPAKKSSKHKPARVPAVRN